MVAEASQVGKGSRPHHLAHGPVLHSLLGDRGPAAPRRASVCHLQWAMLPPLPGGVVSLKGRGQFEGPGGAALGKGMGVLGGAAWVARSRPRGGTQDGVAGKVLFTKRVALAAICPTFEVIFFWTHFQAFQAHLSSGSNSSHGLIPAIGQRDVGREGARYSRGQALGGWQAGTLGRCWGAWEPKEALLCLKVGMETDSAPSRPAQEMNSLWIGVSILKKKNQGPEK